ncbi:NUDIX hydrolase [Rhodococcus sp. D2-41]|uniref:NUDIX hydrolase n=1 Tax=Speluncibacter jeojiensis TaxID=2710754 RepID=A0A9X4M876_9ACTN|nr:NUDIX hydrolase [Rhodococcus sp. D2-41]MDG3012800.1 NUDIX hydrolase [Rhodococcus sp. D2-41]MDG3017118.1 NUDIX hydrolase [Corynebacteriales bacterium D3-21]
MSRPIGGTFTPHEAVAPKDAATVILLRDGDRGLEVFLVRRVGAMAFAGGMTVFPGGGVDPQDDDPDVQWSGPAPQWWADRLGTDEPRARRLVCAAARETFEECGVLLAGRAAAAVVADTRALDADRRALEAHELTFSAFLRREQLVLAADRLRPWSHWITPVGESRRYDTRFFVAALPEGQQADGATSEAEEVSWATPADALAQWREGRFMLLPPTWAQLEMLVGFADVAAVMAARPAIAPVQPVLVQVAERWRVEFDGAERYYADLPR